ncbi:MAG: fibronectin type III domain-containing protein, partial [candidate division WOR-3 bacterium]|nr:fibronectin type III domain-containing protein [candidate division WOR-3 bacterium]
MRQIPYNKLLLILLCVILPLGAVTIEPPQNVFARDNPNDDGGRILITWQLSPSDSLLEGYQILRRETDKEQIDTAGFIGRGRNLFVDEGTTDGIKYTYQIVAVCDSLEAKSTWSNLASSKQQWFHTERINVVVFTLLFTFLIVYFINRAKKGANLFIRKIAGLLAVDEAVGRATEMGKPILYVPGLTGISDVATIAAMNILGEIAKKIATYDSQLIVPNTDPIVFTV